AKWWTTSEDEKKRPDGRFFVSSTVSGSGHREDGQPDGGAPVFQRRDAYDFCLSVQSLELAVLGGDVYLQLVPHGQLALGFDLHAGAGEIEALSPDFPSCMMQGDLGFQAHADEVSFLAVGAIALTHGRNPLVLKVFPGGVYN